MTATQVAYCPDLSTLQQPPSETTLALIVDDDRATRLLLRVALQREGLSVIEASSGTECLAVLQSRQPDLILMDAVMPEMDGFTCCAALRKQASGTKVPILMITSLNDPNSVDHAFEAGATDYLSKPIHWALLRHRIHRLQDMIKRQQAEYQLKVSLREKEALLKEIHHRVKNNLQIISSLLNLQAYSIKDDTVLNLFRESQNRICLMALVHEKLYQSNNLGKISFLDYVETLSRYILSSYKIDAKEVELIIDFDDIYLEIDIAVPCGLIINELMSNALKYAFLDVEQGIISIRANIISKDRFSIVFEDNGIGISKEIDIHATETLGLQLVLSLTQQLEGELEIQTDCGTTFYLNGLSRNN
ncbi:MAG: response regulator [Leptolyngbyaceae cyanobacterium]